MSDNSMSSAMLSKAYIAVNRFGYGAKGNELKEAKSDPASWISSKLLPVSFDTSLPNSNDLFIEHANYQLKKKQQKKKLQQQMMREDQSNKAVQKNKVVKNKARASLIALSTDTLNQAISSSHSVSWRLLDFFSNHFSVSASSGLMVALAPTLEREAIAPNLFGHFEDMLLAVEQHPAMLIYLNNEKSFGPNSRLAKKRKIGLNENLSREIMELHTLGVDSGYTQKDVIELAKGITGWSVKNFKKENDTGFIFRPYGHEPGSRLLLGKKYNQKGVIQGEQMLRDLAMNSKTITHVCTKIAHHFVSQKPPPALIKKMESTWVKTQGNIKQIMLTLFNAEEAWITTPQQFKSPRDFVISTFRAITPKKSNNKALLYSLTNLGQKPFDAGSPAGFSDNESNWLGASALMARIDWSMMVAGNQKRINSEKVMNHTLGDSVSQHTYQTVMRAESREQSVALLLMSPEFQRR